VGGGTHPSGKGRKIIGYVKKSKTGDGGGGKDGGKKSKWLRGGVRKRALTIKKKKMNNPRGRIRSFFVVVWKGKDI